MRTAAAAVMVLTLGCGNQPFDYPPAPLAELGLHHGPTYVAQKLNRLFTVLIAHPRLGQPAIRRAGEPFEVSWIAPGRSGLVATAALEEPGGSTVPLDLGAVECDADGVCHAGAVAPHLGRGLLTLCVTVGDAADCSPAALALVDAYADPALIAQVSDVHAGSDEGAAVARWRKVVDALNRLSPPPDFVVFSGDAADVGLASERAAFLAELIRLRLPAFVVTGNHDFDNRGIEGHLLQVGPELDFTASYGGLRLIGLSTGQDLDDGHHIGTISQSGGPDRSQLDWLAQALAGPAPTIALFHHPLYFGLFATVGPSRDQLLRLLSRDSVRAVLTGHIHHSAVFDREGQSRGLDTGSDLVPSWRWPLHYVCSKSTDGAGGFALHRIGSARVEYRWIDLAGR